MRRLKILAWASCAAAAVVAGGWASAGIEGSKHDFSNEAWSKGDKCGACHTPNHQTPPKTAPLWNPKADLTQRFGTTVRERRKPGGGTLICLRCHDGTIAKESFTGVKAKRFVHQQHPGLFRAGHNRSDHPVGIAYPQFDKDFHPATSVIAKGTVTLPNGRVECISCHDPHNTSGQDHMLVTGNARSALCLTCHKK